MHPQTHSCKLIEVVHGEVQCSDIHIYTHIYTYIHVYSHIAMHGLPKPYKNVLHSHKVAHIYSEFIEL